jgi:hypothetical protein
MSLSILTHTAAHKNNIDVEFDRTFNGEQNEQEGSIEATLQHESNWDEWDDEDAEGEDEEGWIDPDAASNESSVTLSSKASSKRSYDDVDPSEHAYVEDPHASPGTSCAFPLCRMLMSLQARNGSASNDVTDHFSQRLCPPPCRARHCISAALTYRLRPRILPPSTPTLISHSSSIMSKVKYFSPSLIFSRGALSIIFHHVHFLIRSLLHCIHG